MNHRRPLRHRLPAVLLLALLLPAAGTAGAAPLLDDRAITLNSARDIAARRRALVEHVWGAEGFPEKRLPSQVLTNVAWPVRGLTNLARVDELRFDLAPGLQSLAYHFVPARPNRELVVVHHGHACTFDDSPAPDNVGYGLRRTIQGLLSEGYGVLGVFMPRMRPGDCTGGHEGLFALETTGNPMKFFLEPVALGLNYLRARSRADRFPAYRTFHMTGLSGGGWATTVYAALDPTIRCSVPVAGTIPLHLRSGGSVGDREQFDPAFYRIAGYPDLYVLGAHGRGRRQVQVLVRRDDCCFGQAQHDAAAVGQGYAAAMTGYAARVGGVVDKLGEGSFRLVIDDAAPSHMISHEILRDVLLPELKRAR